MAEVGPIRPPLRHREVQQRVTQEAGSHLQNLHPALLPPSEPQEAGWAAWLHLLLPRQAPVGEVTWVPYYPG